MLQDWTRPHYRPNGGEPFLFYVVYGTVDLAYPLSKAHYRSEGIPDGIDIMHYGAEQHADVISGFRQGYLWERFCEREPLAAERIASASECVILRGTPVNSTNLNYLRDTVGLLTHFLDHGGLCIYDPQMFEWWVSDAWRERIFSPDDPVPQRHVTVLTSSQENSTLTWFHTRGMRKFGRPDLSVSDVPQSHHAAVTDLCVRLIEHQAFGAVIPEGQRIQMRSLPEGITCRHSGDLDDPDFNNVHIEMRFGSGAV